MNKLKIPIRFPSTPLISKSQTEERGERELRIRVLSLKNVLPGEFDAILAKQRIREDTQQKFSTILMIFNWKY